MYHGRLGDYSYISNFTERSVTQWLADLNAAGRGGGCVPHGRLCVLTVTFQTAQKGV